MKRKIPEEIMKLDALMTGQIPYNFGSFGNGATNRIANEFTWNDLEANLNDAPYHSDTCIIVTSYHGHLPWLKATLSSYRKSGAFVILAYDNPLYIWANYPDKEYGLHFLPNPLHYLLAHAVVVKHKTYDADKRTGWYWDVKYAQAIINGFKNFKYVYVTNGDCIIEKPDGIWKLPEILGDGDMMSGQSTPGGTIHTADMFLKIDCFNKIMDYMSERMRFPINGSQSPEGMLREAVDKLDIKETFVKQAINPNDGSVDYYSIYNADSTWKEVLGYRNIYHSFEYHENNGLEPVGFDKYVDPWNDYFYVNHIRQSWYNTIVQYWKTGDKRYLCKFWDEGNDTDTERVFKKIESGYYGNEPVYGNDEVKIDRSK
jgi:hypothetical protein